MEAMRSFALDGPSKNAFREIGSQARIICSDHGIPEVHIHGEERPVSYIPHQRGSTCTGNSRSTVGPSDDRPAPSRRFSFVRKQHDPRHRYIFPGAEREWYRMRTAETENGSSYCSNSSERISSPGLPVGNG